MSDLLLEPTASAQWQHLLKKAEQQCGCSLDDELESYLVFTLIRFTENPELASRALAPDFLRSAHLARPLREQQLRDVGDQCLLLAGLFPQRAERRLVRISYYVDMGRTAYDHLSQLLNQAIADLYRQLAQHFVLLRDVLHNIRREPQLQPLQALELWQDTGSRHARELFNQATSATPVILPSHTRH